MTKLNMKAVEFKKMTNPVDPKPEHKPEHVKYVCYIQANTIPEEVNDWFGTNPREQKMTTDVARNIQKSLENNSNFHELNRGIVFSADSAVWDNKTHDLEIVLNDPETHGNIDGGHTLRAILDAKHKNILDDNRYVFVEIFTGLDNPVDFAAARNTSVQVDLKSIEELNKSFGIIKKVFEKLPFSKRIQYKMNEHYNDNTINNVIDVRDIIAITIMFSQEIYPYKLEDGLLCDIHPIQCYSGKEASLRKFLNFSGGNKEENKTNREKMISNMEPLIQDIFELWEEIETNFAAISLNAGKRYGSKKYSKYDAGKEVGKSFVKETPLKYIVPKGLMYPLIGAFRALVEIDKSTGKYHWKKNPKDVWHTIGYKLVGALLNEPSENPESIGKNTNLWSNLFKDVYVYGREK